MSQPGQMDFPDRVKLIKKNIDLYLEEGARGRALEDLRSAIVSRVTPRLRSALYVSVGQRLSLTRRADAQRASASLIRLSRPASSMRQRSAMTNSSKSPETRSRSGESTISTNACGSPRSALCYDFLAAQATCPRCCRRACGRP